MGSVHGANPVPVGRTRAVVAALTLVLAACSAAPQQPGGPGGPGPAGGSALPPALPDNTGYGVHVLALDRAPNGATWVGTYGDGVYVLPRGGSEWRHLAAGDSGAISWGFVNSFGFERDSMNVWYGTVGNGFGRSTDGGRTWRNWTFSELGPEWQYVVPGGVVVRRDTAYIATADGLRISGDGGATWRCIQDAGRTSGGAAPRDDGCTERINALPTEYLLALDVAPDGTLWVGHLKGLSTSRDGGRTWTAVEAPGLTGERVRAVRVALDTVPLIARSNDPRQPDVVIRPASRGPIPVWATTESRVFADTTGDGRFVEQQIRVPGYATLPGSPRDLIPSVLGLPPAIATSYGLVARLNEGGWRMYYVGAADRYRPSGDIWTGIIWGPPYRPLGASAAGLARILAGDLPVQGIFDTQPAAQPEAPRHLWFRRPIDGSEGNPHIDATYRYGSTMGGNFQQHQGVEFNNPAGTPVRAIGDGVVVYAGPAEAGALTVAIRHDRQWEGQHVFSTYFHNNALDVQSGQRVSAGQVIARVGNTGRATNDHLHLEVHVAPAPDSAAIVHPEVRFPPHSTNPQLWIEPLPGTGVVVGRVFDGAGEAVAGARIHGLVLPYPEETPFSFAETYRERARGTPSYGEHFAVGDVPAGDYTIGTVIDGRQVWRRIRVAAGMVTQVELRP